MATGDKGDKSRIGYAIEEESVFGEVDSAGTAYMMRIRPGAGLKNDPDDKEWEEAQPDRMSRGTSRVGNKSAGDINCNVHLDDPVFQILLRMGLCADFYDDAAAPNAATGVTVSAVDNSFNGTGIGTNLLVGQMFRTANRGNAANNGEFRVAPGSGPDKIIASYGALVTESSGNCTITGSTMIRNGLTRKSASIEKFSTDIAGRRFLFTGQTFNTWGMDINAADFLAMKFGLMGRAAKKRSTPGLHGTYTPAGTSKPADASNHITAFRADDLLYVPWSKVGFTYDNKAAAQIIGGTIDPDGYSLGKIDLKITMEAFYVEDDPNFDLAFDGEDSSIAYRIFNQNKTAWFTFPLFTYNGDPTPQDGADGAAMMQTQGTAKFDPVTQCVLQVDLFL